MIEQQEGWPQYWFNWSGEPSFGDDEPQQQSEQNNDLPF